jgi:predicted CopG family antitoxin
MNSLLNSAPTYFKNIYNNFIQSKIKGKHNIILEPLQVMIQLSLLSFCPIGTKITINNNIMALQPPTISQPLNRWFNYDKKDDIYHLFQVIKRFIKWYGGNEKSKNCIINKTLYTMLLEQGKEGISNLIKTYQNCDMLTIIPVLQMYKDLLKNNDITKIYDEEKNASKDLNEINTSIDKIFVNISKIYNKEIVNVIFHTLELLKTETNPSIIENYIDGINLILLNINTKITLWINENLVV